MHLGTHPEVGRPLEDMPEAFREWPIGFASGLYLARYRFEADQIVIVAIRYSREAGYEWLRPRNVRRRHPLNRPTALAIPGYSGILGVSPNAASPHRKLMTESPVLLSVDARGVATVTLNRPEVGNAYNAAMLDGLIQGLTALAPDPAVRCLVIRGAGKHFQAGADIRWLGEVADYPPAENYAASVATTKALQLLNEFPKPTIAVVHGACFGGGVGVVCCVDVAFATPDSQFGITEIRVGVSPTPISTHMVNAIGLRQTRRYALTGERFDAHEAERIGLIHEVVAADVMEAKLASVIDAVFLGSPTAIAMTKSSFLGANDLLLDDRQISLLAHEGWTQRHSPEGHEGTLAFREKRKPSWYKSAGTPT
jgi:methylglutaconyl-CoA hydratase